MLGSVLMPVINDAVEQTYQSETYENSAYAYGIPLEMKKDVNNTNYIIEIDTSTSTINVTGSVVFSYSLASPTVLWRDSNLSVIIISSTVYFRSSEGGLLGSKSIPTQVSITVGSDGTINYTCDSIVIDRASYGNEVYLPSTSGNFFTYELSSLQDFPFYVSVYVSGDRFVISTTTYTETTGTVFKDLFFAIPVLVIVALLASVVAIIFRNRIE